MKLKVTLLLGLSLMILTSYTASKDPLKKVPKVVFFTGSYDNFLREAKKQKKPILLEFWASWCAPCRKMDNETFADPKFAAYLNDNFMVYKVNIDTFDGMEIADRYSVDAYPTMVILDNKTKYISRFKGFFPPDYLMNELEKNKTQKGKRLTAPKSLAVN